MQIADKSITDKTITDEATSNRNVSMNNALSGDYDRKNQKFIIRNSHILKMNLRRLRNCKTMQMLKEKKKRQIKLNNAKIKSVVAFR